MADSFACALRDCGVGACKQECQGPDEPKSAG
jgi:hypothetical protein